MADGTFRLLLDLEPDRYDPDAENIGIPAIDQGRCVTRKFTERGEDLEPLADTLVRVSHLATHLDGHFAELDINPLMVLPKGQGVKAVDALVVFRDT